MASFKQAFDWTMGNEGGYANDPDDAGGETYRGISRRAHPQWEGWERIDHLKKLDGFPGNLDGDILLQDMVEQFYELTFWQKLSGQLINSQQVANSLFDFAVNAGCSQSVTLAQRAVGVKDDGVLGEKTLRALNQSDPEFFELGFTVQKVRFYVRLCLKNPAQKKFFFGWTQRSIKKWL